MTGFQIILMVAQGLAFAVWAFLMFRALFGIQRRFRQDTGRQWIGPVAVFSVYGAYLRDPAYRGERRAILIALAVLIVLSVLIATNTST